MKTKSSWKLRCFARNHWRVRHKLKPETTKMLLTAGFYSRGQYSRKIKAILSKMK